MDRQREGNTVRAMVVIYALLAAAIGASVVLQASINGELRTVVGDPYRTALISTTVSTLFLILMSAALVGKPVPDGDVFSNAPWWMWVGGVLGAIYVAASAYLVSKLGSAFMFTVIIFGQLVMAVSMDQFGWVGLEKHPITVPRVVGIALVLVGAVLVRRS
jgi:bacterial/archaeal transporter family-2 protein